ncbi:MAG: hypothetical protein OEZ43_12430 [Gammaproteobacteria bacterium]|nr:hypothetical protein [Gammaproteobacteria bacterium]
MWDPVVQLSSAQVDNSNLARIREFAVSLSPQDATSIFSWQNAVSMDAFSGNVLWGNYQVRILDDIGAVTSASPIPEIQQTNAQYLDIQFSRDANNAKALWSNNGEIYSSDIYVNTSPIWLLPQLQGNSTGKPQLLFSAQTLPFSPPVDTQAYAMVWPAPTLNNSIQGRVTSLARGMGGAPIAQIGDVQNLSFGSGVALGSATIDDQTRTSQLWQQYNIAGQQELIVSQLEPGKTWFTLSPTLTSINFDIAREIVTASLPGNVLMLIGYDRGGNILSQSFHPIVGWGNPQVISESTPIPSSRSNLRANYNGLGDIQVVWLSEDTSPVFVTRVYGNRFSRIQQGFAWNGVTEFSSDIPAAVHSSVMVKVADNSDTVVLWQTQAGVDQTLHFREFRPSTGWSGSISVASFSNINGQQLLASTIDINKIGIISLAWAEVGINGPLANLNINALRRR